MVCEEKLTHGRVSTTGTGDIDRVALGLVDDVDLVGLRQEELLGAVECRRGPEVPGQEGKPREGTSGIKGVSAICSVHIQRIQCMYVSSAALAGRKGADRGFRMNASRPRGVTKEGRAAARAPSSES